MAEPLVCLFNHCFREEWDEADLRVDALNEDELFQEANRTNEDGWTCAGLIANRNGPLSLLERLLQVTGTGVLTSTMSSTSGAAGLSVLRLAA